MAAAPKKKPKGASSTSRGLVIVESPAKARTIGGFLGNEFKVEASVGHVRDLPTSTSELPAEMKKSKWGRLGVDLEHDFEPVYVVPHAKREQIRNLQRLLKDQPALWLATDEDREGEAISWHLVQVLNPKVPIHRLVFHEITEEAIREALDHPRQIDEDLVEAQETRRILDRLYGYEISPVLWRKIRTGLSAGRVQSVALRLLVDREAERIRFRSAEYWDLAATFQPAGSDATFRAALAEVGGKRVASGKDFEPTTGRLKAEASSGSTPPVVLGEKEARALAARVQGRPGTVLDLEEKPYTQRPYAPFTTSTLQQDAGSRLRWPARRTMSVAQRLYESGVITYMRTDSTELSEQALAAARRWISDEYGQRYVPEQPRIWRTKVKNAQEAHEAIRPAGTHFLDVAEVRRRHGDEAAALYELVFKRTVASQMPDAVGRRVTARLGVEDAVFRATGRVVEFDGFQRVYSEERDADDDAADGDGRLPPLEKGGSVTARAVEPLGHRTQPPARYTDASLVKELDARGIGRPSTWASIIDVLLERTYAFRKGTALVPTFTGFVVVRLLTEKFGDLLDYEFTARMEDDLDAISRGEAEGRDYLRRFYLGNGGPGLQQLVRTGIDELDPRKICRIDIGKDGDREVEVRVGKFGVFVTDGEHRASVPEDLPPDEMNAERASKMLAHAAKADTPLGTDDVTGKAIYLKTGRFGPYLQLGEPAGEGEEKPKMTSLLKGMDPSHVTIEIARQLLSFPRNLGPHPEDPEGKPVVALLGRYGPYVKWGEESRSVPADMDVLRLTLPVAVEVLKMPKGGRGRPAPAAPLRELGAHPETKAPMKVMKGRYGPYVTDGTLNASLPRGMDPAQVSVADAVDLLRKRAEKVAAGGGRRRPVRASGGRRPKKKTDGEGAPPPATLRPPADRS